MIIDFPIKEDGTRHRYCIACHSENINDVDVEGKKTYQCHECGKLEERLIDIDPKMSYWIDDTTKEYWHESVGVFIFDSKNRILVFDRTIYPYNHTIPAGHLEKGEDPKSSAIRELREETGLIVNDLDHVVDEDVTNDLCRRGANCHRWHVYKGHVDVNEIVKITKHEGKDPKWLSIEELTNTKLTAPVEFLVKKYADKILS